MQIIDPLPPIDHSEVEYESFVKNFYTEHEEIKSLTKPQVDELRRKLGLRVSYFQIISLYLLLILCLMSLGLYITLSYEEYGFAVFA